MHMRDRRGIGRDGIGNWKAGDIRAVDRKRIEHIEARSSVPRKDLIAISEVVIEPEAALIVVVGQDFSGRKKRWSDVSERIECFSVPRNRADQKWRDLISGKRLAGEFINQRPRLARTRIDDTGEIAASLGWSWHDRRLCFPLAVSLPFIVGEEKVLVPPNGTAERCPELILMQGLGTGGKEIPCIESVVPQELIQRAVKF